MNSRKIKERVVNALGYVLAATVIGGGLGIMILDQYPPEEYMLERSLNGELPNNPIPTPEEKEKMRKIDSIMLQRIKNH
ncbi:MAG: hypothetical protein LCH91_05350 [Bacteroidetes bacterium]|nr:hypothetical protein [Bacteroidota bacterium]